MVAQATSPGFGVVHAARARMAPGIRADDALSPEFCIFVPIKPCRS
jgi:hypothetical protein